jgi:hypothetical protein
MNTADKKKLGIAVLILVLAVSLIAWNLLGGGGSRPSAADSAAQDKVLQSIPGAADGAKSGAEDQAPPAPAAPLGGANAPAPGRPRSVRPGG